MKKRGTSLGIITALLIIIIIIVIRGNLFKSSPLEKDFNRNNSHFIYTKHARCRMDCRHIDEAEVQEILQQGRINYRKSEPAGRPDPKYALEGTTRDGQQVRIVFAPAKRGMVVITVIDLGTEWSCDCK